MANVDPGGGAFILGRCSPAEPDASINADPDGADPGADTVEGGSDSDAGAEVKEWDDLSATESVSKDFVVGSAIPAGQREASVKAVWSLAA